MLEGIIVSLIPILVAQAEKLFAQPQSGAAKKQWVTDMVHFIFQAVSRFVPSWLLPSTPYFEAFVSNLIEAAVDKL